MTSNAVSIVGSGREALRLDSGRVSESCESKLGVDSNYNEFPVKNHSSSHSEQWL